VSRPGIPLALLAVCACLPVSANAAQTARMSAGFTPERLGAATTVSLGFQITAGGSAPSALSALQLAYPAHLGLVTSGLGLAACSPEVLEALGTAACPPDSLMGSGSALVEIQIGPELVKEPVQLAVFAGPSSDGYLHILVYATGLSPVIAQLVLSGVLVPGHIDVVVPPIPSLPEAPYVALAQMTLTIGGDLTYYERVGGRSIPYRPAGVGLPGRCPTGGFPFAATFAFVDGSDASARTAVPCPRRRPVKA
jgi:hypothetical protein